MSKPKNNNPKARSNADKTQKFSEKILKVKYEPARLRSVNKKLLNDSSSCPEKLNGFSYRREKDLPPLIALWPHEIEDKSISGTERVIAKLSTALRAERNRGKSGHWSYDLNRHIALSTALKEEQKWRKSSK